MQSGNLPKRSGLLSPAGGPGGEEDESVLLPLGETTLTDNLGLPIMVFVTKTDAIGTLSRGLFLLLPIRYAGIQINNHLISTLQR